MLVGTAAAASGMAAAPAAAPLARTQGGDVRGSWVGGVRRFTNIPFGQTTGGANRFKAPRPASPWSGVLDATSPAPWPPQAPSDPRDPAPAISEDCLRLNIWAPAQAGPHPVYVWIYGGGNTTGWCGDPSQSGETFARDGVVFVNFNYRVGVLGFLELSGINGAADAGSGNNGIRDQLLALRWVKANIAAFGGDPDRVTLGGESAGAKNVCCLLAVSPARALFQQAVVQSGGGHTVHDLPTATAYAQLFVDHLGGPHRLRTSPVQEVLAAQAAAMSAWPGSFPHRPVIDGAFLAGRPIDLIRAGSARGITLLAGSNADESRLFVSDEAARGVITSREAANVPAAVLAPIFESYARLYPALPLAERTYRLLSAEEYAIPTLRVVEAQAAQGDVALHYRLNYPARSGPFKGHTPHALDLPLTFDCLDSPISEYFGLNENDRPAAQRIHSVWVSFIRSGAIPAWPRYTLATRSTMVFGSTPELHDDSERPERLLWADIL